MKRIRKSAQHAKLEILEAAHYYLLEGGLDAVKVQVIASDLGITDAAIHYHFKNRQSLLEALLKHAAMQLKDKLKSQHNQTVKKVAHNLDQVYRIEGFAKLAMWLSLEGWESEKQGMFDSLVSQWQEQHEEKNALEAKFDIAFINIVMAAEPLLGKAFLRAVGLQDSEQTQKQFRNWMIKKLGTILD